MEAIIKKKPWCTDHQRIICLFCLQRKLAVSILV